LVCLAGIWFHSFLETCPFSQG